MAALEEFELGIDHIRNAFKRADNGFTNAYKMLEAQQQKNHKLEAENAKLRERVAELEELLPDSGRWYRAETVEAYVAEISKLRRFAAVVWEMLTKNEPMFVWQGLADEAHELGVEVDDAG